MLTTTQKEHPVLANELIKAGRVGILLSGGCDSEVLLRAAADVLDPSSIIAFTAVTPFVTSYYRKIVKKTTDHLGIKLIQVDIDPLAVSEIAKNTSERCYFCKKAIYSAIKKTAQKNGITFLADGTNLDDAKQYRPGRKAAEELGINHPLLTARLTKPQIRQLGRLLNMPDPTRPADSCLATRIPEDTLITPEKILLIDKIEQPLRPLVQGRLRARISGNKVTLEYQSIDKKLVHSFEEAIQTVALENKYILTLDEIADL